MEEALPTKGQKKVYHGIGTIYEKRAKKWLESRNFSIKKTFGKPHNDYFDLKVRKDSENWMIEVKGGEKPGVRIGNLVKMCETSGIDKVGLLFMPERGIPLLFELEKMSYAGLKASMTKGKAVESAAGVKASQSRAKG